MIYISGFKLKTEHESCSLDAKNHISVNCCGYEKYITKDITTLRKNGRLDYQLIYLVNGCGTFLANGRDLELSKGNIVIYAPEETQQYSYHHKKNSEVYWAHFTGYGAEELLRSVGLLDSEIHFVGINNTFINYFKKIIREMQLKLPFFEQATSGYIIDLLTLMARTKTATQSREKKIQDEAILKVMEEMHTHYNDSWTISSLAKKCNLSTDWFMHKFKVESGVSAMGYLLQIRLDKARWLLLNSSLSIKEISYIIGYDNPLYFSKLFKKAEGVSPNLYRLSTG